jgi:hypothetical protein
MCEIAEQTEARTLAEEFSWCSNQILQDAPQLCEEFIDHLGNFISQEAIGQAERSLKDRFTRLCLDQANKVRVIGYVIDP